MEKQIKSTGIIVRRIDLNEADQIITVISKEHGKISLLAKGAKRLKSKFCGRLELFYEGHFDLFQGRELGYLNEVESACLLDEAQLDLKARGLLFYMSEVTVKLIPEEQECGEVYLLLNETLKNFDSACGETLFYTYLTKLLTHLGFMADWSKSSQTNEKLDLHEPHYFSAVEGGLYPNVSSQGLHRTLTPSIIKWINFMQREDFSRLKNIQGSKKEREEVFSILKSVLNQLFDRSVKSETFIQTLI